MLSVQPSDKDGASITGIPHVPGIPRLGRTMVYHGLPHKHITGIPHVTGVTTTLVVNK